MAKRRKAKRFVLVAVFLALLGVLFVLLGGGGLLKFTGTWIGSLGSTADHVKGSIEKSAASIEKKVERVRDSINRGGKK